MEYTAFMYISKQYLKQDRKTLVYHKCIGGVSNSRNIQHKLTAAALVSSSAPLPFKSAAVACRERPIVMHTAFLPIINDSQ